MSLTGVRGFDRGHLEEHWGQGGGAERPGEPGALLQEAALASALEAVVNVRTPGMFTSSSTVESMQNRRSKSTGAC